MTWELYNTFKANNNDQRFQKLIYNGIYTDDISVASNEVDITEEGYTYLPVTLKYFDFGNEGMTTCACGNDNIIYRYADVLLMYAECLNETGNNPICRQLSKYGKDSCRTIKYRSLQHKRK